MGRSHQEAMRKRGILLNEVFGAFGHEWSTTLPICEYLLYNTPRGDIGLTPRDGDRRRWSLSSPRGREPAVLELAAAQHR